MTTTSELSQVISERRRSADLRELLKLNAAFSAVSGAIAVLAADGLARTLGIEADWIVRLVGVALLAYAVDLAITARLRPRQVLAFGRIAAVADAAWVVATIGLVIAGVFSAGGAVLMALVAVVVAAFAVTQWRAATD